MFFQSERRRICNEKVKEKAKSKHAYHTNAHAAATDTWIFIVGCFIIFTFDLHAHSSYLTSFIEQTVSLADLRTATPTHFNCSVRTAVANATSHQWHLNTWVYESCIRVYLVTHSFLSLKHLLYQSSLLLAITHHHLLLKLLQLLLLHSHRVLIKWMLLLQQGLLIGIALILVISHLWWFVWSYKIFI